MLEAARRLRNGNGSNGEGKGKGTGKADKLVARGFAWMFSGARMPAPRLVDFVLDRVEKEERRVS